MKGFAILSLHLFAAINCSGAASFTAFVREEESRKTSIFGNPVSCYFDWMIDWRSQNLVGHSALGRWSIWWHLSESSIVMNWGRREWLAIFWNMGRERAVHLKWRMKVWKYSPHQEQSVSQDWGASWYDVCKIFRFMTPSPLSAFGSDLFY